MNEFEGRQAFGKAIFFQETSRKSAPKVVSKRINFSSEVIGAPQLKGAETAPISKVNQRLGQRVFIAHCCLDIHTLSTFGNDKVCLRLDIA